jgi:hypothetical protein
VQISRTIAGGKICRHTFRLLLRLIHLRNRILQYLSKVSATRLTSDQYLYCPFAAPNA